MNNLNNRNRMRKATATGNQVIQNNIDVITARNVTEAVLENTRKELAEIKETADELNQFAENIIDTVREPLLAIDKDLRVIRASRSFYTFFKVTTDETIGELIYELGNHQWDIPKLKELLEEIIPEKNSFDDYEVEHNFSTIGKRVMLLNARQVKRAFGKEEIILLAIEDITERKGKEDSLKETHRATSDFLNILLKHMHAPIIVWDTSMIIKRFNHKFELLSGYDAAEVIDRRIDFLFPKEKIAATLELLKNHLESRQEITEIAILTKGNQLKTVLWNSSRLMDEEGTNIVATILQDITNRKRAEVELLEAKERAEESDRLKTAFLNNVSHEIRTPLNAILGFSGFLNDPDLLAEKRQYYTKIISQSSDQLLAIIDDIFSIASIEAGQQKMQENEININFICTLVNEQFSLMAKEKNVKLSLKTVLADDDAMIITDVTKITQILTNLVGNAIKFTSEGFVNFGYTIKDNQLEFFVEDSGIGIPVDMHEKIFDRFRQVETTAARKFGGSGLGLSISRAYAKLLDGNMWLTSEINKGSVFYFSIPYRNANLKELAEIPSILELNFKFDPPKTLLIAEDDDSNFILMKEMLLDSGLSIIRAANGLEAVELCKSNPHSDLVLMDIKMPEMDGYEATTRIKELRPDLPIIVQTAYSTEADRVKAMESGCSDIISKPINKTMLLSKIHEQLHK